MTAVPLFDLLAREKTFTQTESSLAQLAQSLVDNALADWKRLKEYEERYSPGLNDDPALALKISQSIYEMFRQWAGEAEQVLARVRNLKSSGQVTTNINDLLDAHGFAMARLNFPPEKLMRAMEQVRRGELVSAEELRNELRARLRA